jgi:hypothetical protein
MNDITTPAALRAAQTLAEADLRSAVHLHCTTDAAALAQADFIVVAVPTPVDDAHRSLDSEAIAGLEYALMPQKVAPAERLARARALRGTLTERQFLGQDIDAFKREGRP